MEKPSSVIATYPTHEQAEQAVKDLQKARIDMRTLSIVGKDTHSEQHVVGFYNAGDRMKYWGTRGAFWGGIWGLLFGSAMFFIPGIGPLLVAGPLVAWIVAALEGALIVGGVSVLGAGLASIGIPHDSIVQYETALSDGNYLLVVHGTPEEVAKAEQVIGGTTHSSHTIHGETVFATNHGQSTHKITAYAHQPFGRVFVELPVGRVNC